MVKLMSRKGILPNGFKRAGAGGGVDSIFIHHGEKYNLEIKADLKADYGQRYVKWSDESGWTWRVTDEITSFYTEIGVLELIKGKNIRPNRYLKPKEQITFEDKRQDQKAFEDTSIRIDANSLLNYYKKKGVFYIQIGDGYGFYSLKGDPAQVNAPQFEGDFTLRLRCKTIHSNPTYNYGFLAVLKPHGKPKKSEYNLEKKSGQKFPPIQP